MHQRRQNVCSTLAAVVDRFQLRRPCIQRNEHQQRDRDLIGTRKSLLSIHHAESA
jgi:hypothetical protein